MTCAKCATEAWTAHSPPSDTEEEEGEDLVSLDEMEEEIDEDE